MRKFNFSPKYINNNSANNKKKISNKLNKIEIKPQFLVIGLVAIITVISLIYFIFLKYSPVMNFKYEGYGISGKQITKNLLGASFGSENSQDGKLVEGKNVNLAKIEEQGTIFKKLNSYFIGNKEKTEIDLNYPIYINDKNTIYNLNQDITLISKNFEQIAGYPNISITDGKVYNGNSLERADSKEYIFSKTEEGIYINLKEIKIETTANEYVLPVNSLIVFEENSIRYYSVSNNILVFNEINDVDYNSQIIIKNIEEALITNTQNIGNTNKVDKEYNYEELLTRLGIKENAKNDVEKEETQKEDSINNKEQNKDKEKIPITQENETVPNDQEEQQLENNEQTSQNAEYIKPEVTVEDFKAEVYTAKSNLNIKDPKARIVEAPTFEIYKEGKIYLRRTYTQSGEIIVTGLEAGTEYEIVGKYIYKNEEDKKIENTFYKGKLKTKGYEALGIIELAKEEGEIYNNKIQIKNVKITSDLQNEVIKGIDTVELQTGSIKTVLKNNKVNELIAGKEITIESSEGLKSNTKIEYEIKFYDKKGKELKVKNNEGKTRTSKQEPKVTVKIKEQDIVSVTLGLKLTNKDNLKLENYKYIVRKPNGEIEKEEKLVQTQKEIKLDDLDSNQYYNLKIYADYDLNDNKGKQEQVEIGDLVFATQPLSTLGSVELTVEGKDITTNKAILSYEINEEKTDKRLIQILNSIKVELINKNTGKVAKETEIKEEELQTLRAGQKLEKTYENLVSNTTYEIKITSKVKPGTKEENAPVTYNYQSFTTVKMPAKVEIQNKFVTKDLIDLDVRIDDKDNAILNNKVRMELRDEKNSLVETSEVKTNEDWVRKTYNKLEENKTYTLKFYADEYNEGSTDTTYKRNYLLKTIDILTEEGITGKIDLKSMLKKTTGKNLVDPDSKIKWYTPYVRDNGFYNKNYEKETNTLQLGIKHKNYDQSYTYNLREYIGKEITISFKIKVDEGIKLYIQNSKKKGQNIKKIEDINKDNFKEYKQTLVINNTGYVGFYIQNGNIDENAKAYIKDLQIELGNTKTEYEEYKYNMESKVLVNLEDKRDEILTNDYYIKIYEDGKLVDTKRYEEIPENNKIENIEKELNIKESHDYKLELVVKIRLRDYVISTFKFNTKNGEILGISNIEEYIEIQPEGNYIILNDLDFRGVSIWTSANTRFEGSINFNGKTIYRNYVNGSNSPYFDSIGTKGKIENLVQKIYLKSDLPSIGVNLFSTNHGTISNIVISIEESIEKDNGAIYLIGNNNYGTVENFIINYKSKLYAEYIRCISNNHGNVQNGYLYGEDIKINKNTPNNSILIGYNYGNVKQVFILANSYCDKEDIKSNYSKFALENNKLIENVYSVGIGNVYNIDYTPNVIWDNSKEVKNSYYIGDITFKGTTDKKITNKALWDVNFQNKILNSTNMWEIDELVNLGYYPWLKLNDCMPRQEYIALPEMTDADLPEILFTETLENTNNTAKVKISMYNPSGEDVKEIKVKNIDCTIESQEYVNGKSEIIVNLSNPIQCVASYSIVSFTTKGAFNLEYTREYKEGEILINVDLYNEIYTVEDWYEIKKKGTENYKLMANLDFKNADPKQYAGISFYGILDGRGHTIKNMYISKTVNTTLFTQGNYNTKISNLNINNFNLETKINNVGIIGNANGIKLRNINIDTVNITANGSVNVGLILGVGNNYEIEDITINNANILSKNAISSCIGGVVGNGSGDLNNVYANKINIKLENSREVTSVGGILGYGRNINKKIENIIINGNIETDSGKVGGIIGSGDCSIKNSIIKMNIVANGNFVGGIIGEKSYNNTTEIKNNIYIGNIINKKETEYTGALFGRYKSEGINYIYGKNKINNVIIEDKYKLGIEELSKERTYTDILNFDNSYNYNDLNNKLPLLKNSDKTEILPNQESIYIEDKDVDIKTVNTLREDGNRLKVRLEITNSQSLEITKIEIENMDLEVTEKRNINGVTYIDLFASPTKYYDNYHIKEIKYIKEGKEYTQKIQYLIEEAFYKEITKYEDWQNIDKESYENYKLLTDLDFTGKQSINYNVKIGKLVTEGKMHTIKNLTLNVGNSSTFGLISILKNGIENIKFENINMNITQGININDVGIIGRCEGYIKNIEFKDINMNISGKVTRIGCIGMYVGIFIDTVKTNNIHIVDMTENSKSTMIGGTFGNLQYGEIKNIEGNNINIEVNGNYVGGLIGYMSGIGGKLNSNNIKITNSTIKAKMSNVGGIAGYGGFSENVNVVNCIVEGDYNIGGIVGSQSFYDGEFKNATVIKSHIKGGASIGGIIGKGGKTSFSKVLDSTVEGTRSTSKNIGGIVGEQGWSPENTYVKNSKIIAKGINVGGIAGNSITNLSKVFIENTLIEGYAKVGGLVGEQRKGYIMNSYTNANVVAIEHSAGGLVGYLNNKDMNNLSNISQIRQNYYAGGTIKSKENVGGIIGEIEKELYMAETYYKQNYVEANLISENSNAISLGVGNKNKSNKDLEKTYYYKYSKINGKYPTKENEPYIPNESYLIEENLKNEITYKNKLDWGTGFSYDILNENKYPIINTGVLTEYQEGINIPTDPIIEEIDRNNEETESLNLDEIIYNKENNKIETLQYTLKYNGKIIKTYKTYSEIIKEDGSSIVREGIRLYVKAGKLYALPVELSLGESIIKLVENNFIIDSYNGKEYETVLGSDGRIYDLKAQLNYPENFVNEGIASIGDNLDIISSNSGSRSEEENQKEVEVIYINGDKVRFNYQTGKVISSLEENRNKIGLFDYVKEKISQIGNSNFRETQKITNKYEESKVLQNKLEETPVEEALQRKNSNANKSDNVANDENNEANNSLKERRYISIYNVEKDEYQIYQEEELLDTTKQEVISENDKIEANNLKEYYASEGEAKNTKMGIVWIALSIIGVVIILFAIKKRD